MLASRLLFQWTTLRPVAVLAGRQQSHLPNGRRSTAFRLALYNYLPLQSVFAALAWGSEFHSSAATVLMSGQLPTVWCGAVSYAARRRLRHRANDQRQRRAQTTDTPACRLVAGL